MRIILVHLFFLFTQSLFSQIDFMDVAPQWEVDHYYYGGLGGGISLIDFNQDGLDDLTLASGKDDPIAFYINTGIGLEPIELNIDILSETNQVVWVDYDKDGDWDFYATCFEAPNRLYQNTGDLVFKDVTIESGLALEANNSYGANWIDINRDGWLDLVYGNRVFPLNKEENEFKIYLNSGNGTFTDHTEIAMATDSNKLPFCALAFDYNQDKWPDLFYTHDRAHATSLFENNGDSTFLDVSVETQSSYVIDGMGITQCDINQDGLFDFYVTNIEDGNLLLVNHFDSTTQRYYFEEEADLRGCAFNELSWGCSFADYDNDMDADLYVSAATVQNNGQTLSSLYLNDQGFFNLQESFSGDSLRSFSNATGDFNNDGFMDIAVLNTFTDPAQIWLNQSAQSSNQNWIKIDLLGRYSNKEGIGSTIKIFQDGITQVRFKECTTSFLGQSSSTLHIGLGNYTFIDSIEVLWPTGHMDKVYNQPVNKKILITEGQTNNEIIVDNDVNLLNPPSLITPHFNDITSTSGIDHFFNHSNFLGGGLAFFDMDNDGDEDVYMTSGRDRDKIYRNNGLGKFDDISATANIQLSQSFYTNGVIAGDINNDGFTDLFISTTGNTQETFARNLLYLNNGNETFTEIWLQQEEKDKAITMGASFIDYDQDGYLDIYTVNYVDEIGFLYDDDGTIIGFDHECFENRMYRNREGSFFFDDVTEELGLNDFGCALAVVATDFDLDADQDLLLANDFGEFVVPNSLYRNDSLSFSEVSTEWNADQAIYGMGIAVGDLNNDLDLDYYITNNGSNVLLKKNAESFDEIAEIAGVQDTWEIQDSILSVSWGTAFIDYDNDADLDLYVANGYVPGPSFLETSINNNDRLFENLENDTFGLLSIAESGIDNFFASRGTASADINNDGSIDLITSVLNVPQNSGDWESKVYLNQKGQSKNWIQFTLEGILANRDAIGSQIKLYGQGYNTIKEISGGDSHCSHSSKVVHFGLDTLELVDSIHVIWPSRSRVQKLYDLSPNQRLSILEDTAGTFISLDTMNMDTMDMDTMDVDTSLMTNDLFSNLEVEVFPNPTKNLLFAKANQKIYGIEIKSITGQRVRKLVFPLPSNKQVVSLNKLSKGPYFLTLFFEDGLSINRKILVVDDD